MNEGKIFLGPTITQPPPPISQFHHDGTIITASSNMSVVGEDQYSSNSDIDDSLLILGMICVMLTHCLVATTVWCGIGAF